MQPMQLLMLQRTAYAATRRSVVFYLALLISAAHRAQTPAKSG
jgi:hypothetical protein